MLLEGFIFPKLRMDVEFHNTSFSVVDTDYVIFLFDQLMESVMLQIYSYWRILLSLQ